MCPDGLLACTEPSGECDCLEEPEEPEVPAVEIPVTDENRFVREDLDAFIEARPDVLGQEGTERMRTCVADECLDEIHESVNPFAEEGALHLVPLWYRACLSGSGEGCLRAAQTYNSSTVGEDPIHEGVSDEELHAKTHQYATRACELDESQCRMWCSEVLSEETSSAEEVSRAIQLLTDECAEGGHFACGLLGEKSERGQYAEAIGPARGWFEKACAIETDELPNRYCDDIATLLFATGSRADRAEAIRILTPICEVPSETWATSCEGDPESGTLECSALQLRFRDSCPTYAESLSDAEALPILTALCRSVAAGDARAEANRQVCGKAERVARRLRRSDAYIRNLRIRVCTIDRMGCWLDDGDMDACEVLFNECQERPIL